MRIRVQFSFVFLLLAMTGQPGFGASNRTADIVIAGGEKKTPDVPAAAIAEIRPRAPSYRFPERQTLVYGAEWRLFNAGTVTLRTEPSGAAQQVIATADTYGIVNLLFSVHDKFRTSLDPKSFCSIAVNKHTEEGKRRREINLRFEYQRRKSVFDEKNLNNGGQMRTGIMWHGKRHTMSRYLKSMITMTSGIGYGFSRTITLCASSAS